MRQRMLALCKKNQVNASPPDLSNLSLFRGLDQACVLAVLNLFSLLSIGQEKRFAENRTGNTNLVDLDQVQCVP